MSAMQTPPTPRAPLPTTGYVLLAALTLFWGANWPGMKIALAEIPVWWFRAMCVWAGAIGILGIARASGASLRMQRHEIARLLLVSAFAMLGWQIFSAYGVSLMPAGRASIIAFTMPVWSAFLGAAILDEPITGSKVAGLVLGTCGLAILMGEDIFVLKTAPLGALCMLAAALSWAVGTVLFKAYRWQTPIAALVGWQLAAAAVPITLVALLSETPPDFTQLSTRAVLALVYVFALPMIFCQWAFFKVVSIFPASIASMGTLAVPIVGVYSSALILGEEVGWREGLSLILILAALTAVMIIPALARKR